MTLTNKTRLALLVFVLALAMGYLVYAAFPGNTLYYLTVGEFLADAQAMDGKSGRVVGKLVPGSLQEVSGTMEKKFTITDQREVLHATYSGPLPGLFESPHSDIVLEGSFSEGRVFQTDTVIVKCPSKYKALREDA